MSDALKKFQDQLITRGLGTGLPFFPGLPSLDSAGLRFDPPKRKIGEISQGILSALEKGAKLTDKALTYPAELGESAVEYLLSPSEIAKQQAQEKRDSITKSLSLDELFYPSGNFREDERKIAEAQGMRFDPVDLTEKIRDLSPSGPKADQLVIDAEENKNQRDKTQKEAITSLAQLNQEVAEDEMGRKPPSEPVIEDAFSSAMQDYIEQARGAGPETKELSLDDYKKEFAEATGIDISGKVDKSSALMAFGLALMQNRAGKGFNVGRMLSEVGKAGEVALPALEKAKTQARNDAIAAGKYALETRAADRATDAANQEKAMIKDNYFIVPNKGGGVSGDIAGILSDEGRLERLNKYELNALMKDKDFTNKFTILPGSTHAKVVEEALSTKDGTALWDDKVVTRNLIEGIDDPLFSIDLSYGKSGGSKQGQYVLRDVEQIAIAENALLKMAQDNEKAREQFIQLGILTGKNRNVFNYTADKLSSLASAFGVQFNPEETERDNIIRILENLAMKNASTILGESGKTISDGDRQRVERIVGQLNLTTDIRTLRPRIESLFRDIILGTETKIAQGLTNLSRYSGKDYGLNSENPLNEDEEAELAGYEN